MKSTRHTGSLAFNRRSGCSATLHAVPLSERNSGGQTSRSSKKTAGNKTKRKMEYWSTIPRVMMMTFHLWSERLIFTPEEVPASEELFASTAKLCSVNFSLSSLLWNYGIA